MYSIDIRNCNKIIDGHIVLEEGKLNIKYGINGTGKSTIARALAWNDDTDKLQSLQSYFTEEPASITISPEGTRTLIFNEKFVNDIVFQDDSVIENAFEVFVKTPDYDRRKAALDQRLGQLHEILSTDENVRRLMELTSQLREKFNRSDKTDKLMKRGTMKSILSKQNIYNVPEELEDYRAFFQNHDIAIPWIDWRNKGDQFDTSERCPYCSQLIPRKDFNKKKHTFQKTYKKSDSQNLKELLELLEALKDYIDPDQYQELITYVKEDTPEDVLLKIMGDLDQDYRMILQRFEQIRNFGHRNLVMEDTKNLDKTLTEMRFPIGRVFTYFTSPLVQGIFKGINDAIDSLIGEINSLKKDMGMLKKTLTGTIRQSQEDINEFLRSTGIQYEIEIITEDEENSRTLLRQCFTEDRTEVDRIPEHLSWGEKNAFALILFMYYAESQNSEIIILDDPISSFDTNKKYAILQRMFKNIGRRAISFEGKTVLLLTHDLNPVIDFMVVGKLDKNAMTASFIWNDQGTVREQEIGSHDVKIIMNQCESLAQLADINMASRVAFLRKLCELNENKDEWEYVYQILSCLVHGTEIRRKKGRDIFEPMPQAETDAGILRIQRYITDFDYQQVQDTIFTIDALKKLYARESVPYFKVQIFREISEIVNKRNLKLSEIDNGWFKFVDETYHISNDDLYYLDLQKFNVVPDYIMRHIDDVVQKL